MGALRKAWRRLVERTLGPYDSEAGPENLPAVADTGLLADAISDGDWPMFRDQVDVTPSGALVVRGAR